MTETFSPGETPGSFKLDKQDAARLAGILDLIASKPAVRTLKAWALEALRPAPGEASLDVGSGTGEDLVELARRVGPDGRAVGVEPSPGLRAEALRRTPGLEIVDGDTLSLPFDDASFDVVRSERVLQHVSDPAEAVAEMARVLRPGGRIALIDTDWATAIVHPADPDVLGRMVDFFLSETANPYSGRTLRGLLAEAGLTITGETAATWIDPQEDAEDGFLAIMAQGSAAAGVVMPEEADTFRTTITDAATRGTYHLSVTMYAVSAAKT